MNFVKNFVRSFSARWEISRIGVGRKRFARARLSPESIFPVSVKWLASSLRRSKQTRGNTAARESLRLRNKWELFSDWSAVKKKRKGKERISRRCERQEWLMSANVGAIFPPFALKEGGGGNIPTFILSRGRVEWRIVIATVNIDESSNGTLIAALIRRRELGWLETALRGGEILSLRARYDTYSINDAAYDNTRESEHTLRVLHY